jgi:single-strand DNA-binding protein
MGNYVKKGNLIAVQGMIKTGSYKDRDGRTVYTTDVLVRNVQALESKRERGSAYDYPHNGTSVSRDDISRDINNQGFDTGDVAVAIDNDDLPF